MLTLGTDYFVKEKRCLLIDMSVVCSAVIPLLLIFLFSIRSSELCTANWTFWRERYLHKLEICKT